MRIGVDVRCFAQGKRTGVEGYTQHMLEALFRDDQHNEYVLFFNALRQEHVDWTWIEKYPHVHLKKYSFPNKVLNLLIWLLQYPKIDQLCGGVDLFLMPNINFVALSTHVPLVLTVHDLSFEHYAQTFSYKRRAWHYIINPRKLIGRATHIFAVSENTKEDLCATYKRDPRTITVTLNGLTSVKGAVDRNDLLLINVKEKYHLPYHFILYFGTIEPRKNISGLVQAYTMLREMHPEITHHLVLAGSRGWGTVKIDEIIERSPYQRDIHVVTDVPEEEKEAFFALATVFVYPSFFEGFGFPPLEAAVCKKPIITSHTSSLPEVVGAHALMVDPYRIEELSTAIFAILTERSLATQIADIPDKEFYRTFSWHRNAQEMIHVFNGFAHD